MRTGLVIDSACDLPMEELKGKAIHILPLSLLLGRELLNDSRDGDSIQTFYRRYRQTPEAEVEVRPCSVAQIIQLFLDRLIYDYDRVMMITLSQQRSRLFANATEAAFEVLKLQRQRRQRAGLDTPFHLSVMDSKTAFTGEAILVFEALRLLASHTSLNRMRQHLDHIGGTIRTFLLPRELQYLRQRSRNGGHGVLGMMDYLLGRGMGRLPLYTLQRGDFIRLHRGQGFTHQRDLLCRTASQAVLKGLAAPIVALSYAGPLQEIREIAAFKELEAVAQQHRVTVTLAPMSTIAGLELGPGAFSIAYAC